MPQAEVARVETAPTGTPKRIVPKVAPLGGKSTISHMQRPRSEAAKGEVSLGYILFDGDSNLATKADQALIGFGPSLPDPLYMGKMALYNEVEPWRSIFDTDAADRIVPFEGDCAAADAAFSTAVVGGQAR